MIIANMATYPARSRCLETAVASLLPQVDQLNLCLNQYDATPAFLAGSPKINALIPTANHKDIGKFVFDAADSDYVLLVDDDILYPPDYAQTMIARLESLGDLHAAVGVHGVIYSDFFDGRTASRMVHAYFLGLATMKVVNQIGTGTTVVRGRDMPPAADMVTASGFADVRFARLAHERGMALVCADREKGWLTPIEHGGETLFETTTRSPSKAVLAEIARFGGFARLPLEAVAQVELSS